MSQRGVAAGTSFDHCTLLGLSSALLPIVGGGEGEFMRADMTMVVGLTVHILCAVVWVGGMFFAHQCLRPSAGALEPAIRLPLWHRVFTRFFPWVWVSVVGLLASGYAMVFLGFGGFEGLAMHINVMQGLGIIMVLIYLHLYFAPWKRFRRAVAAGDLPVAARNLDQIRQLVTINLVLGLVTVVVGASGRYWG
jgi:uncharacterized membrane protein